MVEENEAIGIVATEESVRVDGTADEIGATEIEAIGIVRIGESIVRRDETTIPIDIVLRGDATMMIDEGTTMIDDEMTIALRGIRDVIEIRPKEEKSKKKSRTRNRGLDHRLVESDTSTKRERSRNDRNRRSEEKLSSTIWKIELCVKFCSENISFRVKSKRATSGER